MSNRKPKVKSGKLRRKANAKLGWGETNKNANTIRKIEKHQQDFNYYNTGGNNGPTGHGDTCYSDADSGL